MSRVSCPWEAPSIVFYVSRRLQGGPTSNQPKGASGSPKTLARASSEVWRVWRLEVTNVSRIVSLGGSIYRILRVSEAPGRSRFRVAKRT